MGISYIGPQTFQPVSDTATVPTGLNFHTVRMAQTMMFGGGQKFTDSSRNISWSGRFIAISPGRGAPNTSTGYWDIIMPPDGTVINGYNTSDVTVTGGRIPMPVWGNLWYKLPANSNHTSVATNYYLTSYTGTDFTPPADWILVASINSGGTEAVGAVKWGDGTFTDYWRTPTLQNGWVAYDTAAYGTLRYMRVGENVHLTGLIKSGTTTGGTLIATLPNGWWPASIGTQNTDHVFGIRVAGGTARVDVISDGRILVREGAVTGWMSFAGICFPAMSG